jgi:hypothetical protein
MFGGVMDEPHTAAAKALDDLKLNLDELVRQRAEWEDRWRREVIGRHEWESRYRAAIIERDAARIERDLARAEASS